MADRKKLIGISAETAEILQEYAAEKGISIGEACDALVLTAYRRRTAVTKYAHKAKAPAKPASRRRAA